MTRSHPIPSVPGVLTSAQVAQTAASIVAMQESDGAVPWSVGEHVDVWNHVEAAMALMASGEVAAAEAAYAWCAVRANSVPRCAPETQNRPQPAVAASGFDPFNRRWVPDPDPKRPWIRWLPRRLCWVKR